MDSGAKTDRKEQNTPKARVKKTATTSMVVETAEGEGGVASPALETGQQQAVPVMDHTHTAAHDFYTPPVAPPPGFFPPSRFMQFPYGDYRQYGFPHFPQPVAGPTWRPDWDTWSTYMDSVQSRPAYAHAHAVSDNSDNEDRPVPERKATVTVISVSE